MGLTALEIYKLLPRTNCRKCGFSTCLAFAMQLASGKPGACPDIAAESRERLENETRPPIAEVRVGTHTIGGDTALYRHEKKLNPCLLCITVDTDAGEGMELIDRTAALHYVRAGEEMRVDMVRVKGSGSRFLEAAVHASGMALMLDAPMERLEKALAIESVAAGKPLLATDGDFKELCALAKRHGCPLLVEGDSMEQTKERASVAAAEGVADVVLSLKATERERLHFLTAVRRLAVIGRDRDMGHPTLAMAGDFTAAAMAVAAHASIVVMPGKMLERLEPLLALKQAIYSDPQKPLQMRPGLYEINGPGPGSRVIVTTNFSLTFHTVSGDIEASKAPAYLVVVDTEGQSVLTSFASEKLTAERICKAIRDSGVMERAGHNEVIIPGLVPALKGDIEACGLRVTVGPRNSSKLKALLASGGEVR